MGQSTSSAIAAASVPAQHIFLRDVLSLLSLSTILIALAAKYLPKWNFLGNYLYDHEWPFWVTLAVTAVVASIVVIDEVWRRRRPLNFLTTIQIVLLEVLLAAFGSAVFGTQVPFIALAIVAVYCLLAALALWVSHHTLEDRTFYVEPYTGLILIAYVGGIALFLWYKSTVPYREIVWASVLAALTIAYIVRRLRNVQQGLDIKFENTHTDEPVFIAVSLLAEPASLFLPHILWPRITRRFGHSEPLLGSQDV